MATPTTRKKQLGYALRYLRDQADDLRIPSPGVSGPLELVYIDQLNRFPLPGR